MRFNGQNNGGTASTDHKMQMTGHILYNEHALCHMSGDTKFKQSNSINVVFICYSVVFFLPPN